MISAGIKIGPVGKSPFSGVAGGVTDGLLRARLFRCVRTLATRGVGAIWPKGISFATCARCPSGCWRIWSSGTRADSEAAGAGAFARPADPGLLTAGLFTLLAGLALLRSETLCSSIAAGTEGFSLSAVLSVFERTGGFGALFPVPFAGASSVVRSRRTSLRRSRSASIRARI
jgi:hypothetical protein